MNVTSSTPGRNVLSFKLSGSEKMRIASDGSVGIGTAAPATTLDVSGTTTLKGTTNLSNNNIINIANAGIGTAAPAYKLDVIGSGSDNIVCRLQSGGGNTSTTYVNTGASNLDVGTGSGGHFVYGYGSYPLYFGTNGSEKMRITSTGNVGIGTSTPEYTLDVNGIVKTKNPYLLVTGNQNNNVTSNNGEKLKFNTIFADTHNGFSTSQYVYTVPRTGYYLIGAGIYLNSTGRVILIAGGNPQVVFVNGVSSTTYGNSIIMYCTQGDAVYLQSSTNGLLYYMSGTNPHTYMYMYMIG